MKRPKDAWVGYTWLQSFWTDMRTHHTRITVHRIAETMSRQVMSTYIKDVEEDVKDACHDQATCERFGEAGKLPFSASDLRKAASFFPNPAVHASF